MKYKSIEEIKRKIEYYCAYQERSHYQVEKKLLEWGMYPDSIDYLMHELIQENFLNEERFARTYVRGKFYQKKWGKQKIIQGLKTHKIHPNLIDKALDEIEQEDYRQSIVYLIEKKRKALKKTDKYQNLQKIVNYMLQKGYKYDEFFPFLPKN